MTCKNVRSSVVSGDFLFFGWIIINTHKKKKYNHNNNTHTYYIKQISSVYIQWMSWVLEFGFS